MDARKKTLEDSGVAILPNQFLLDAFHRGQIRLVPQNEKPDGLGHIEPLYFGPGGYATSTQKLSVTAQSRREQCRRTVQPVGPG